MGFEIINKLKKEKGLTNAQISNLSGITLSTLDKITSGVNKNPKLDTLLAICRVLDCSLNDFMEAPPSISKNLSGYSEEALKVARDYDKLDQYGKALLQLIVNEEKRRMDETNSKEATALISSRRKAQSEEVRTHPLLESKAPDAAAQPEEVVYYVISGFYQPMSAGTGAEACDGGPEDFMLTKRPPRGASYVAPVSGDSMEPTFRDGDRLFVHACDQIEPGRIGVFLMDGKQWVKELGDGVLLSHNPAYAPIPITPDIRCQGLVLGVCDSSYFG